jgi:DTW domain-containing protein YfiP
MPFSIMICSHPKEWQKNNNSGHWAFLSSENIERLKWHRKPERIKTSVNLDQIKNTKGNYLLFPSDDAQVIYHTINHQNTHIDSSIEIKKLWVIDGTWQEAQKMLSQSPWLNNIPKIKISASEDRILESRFVLRRNQRGLSTIEAISSAIAIQSTEAADALDNNFDLFQKTLLKLIK